MLKGKMINKKSLLIIAALILVPLFWVILEERKVQVQPVEAAPDEISVWWWQLQGNRSGGHYCDGVFYRNAGKVGDREYGLRTWGDEPTAWVEGRFTGLDPSITYRGYIEALSDSLTGTPEAGRIQIVRSDGEGWNDVRPGLTPVTSGDWGVYSYGTFSGVTSMNLEVKSFCTQYPCPGYAGCGPQYPTGDPPGCSCGPQSDIWVRRVYLVPETCGNWGPNISPTCQQQNGLWGRYYRDNPVGGDRFDGGIKWVKYGNVNLDWGTKSPNMNKLECDHFSARWTGYVKISSGGNWRFRTRSDDGVRLWLDDDGNGNFSGDRIINNWSNGLSTDTSDPLNLDAGWYEIQLDYYENTGSAEIQLLYRGPGTDGWEIIPKSQFRSCEPPVGPGPDLTCKFTEISSGAIVGSGTEDNPYKIQRGTEEIKIQITADPDPGGGTMNFSAITPSGAENTFRTGVGYGAGGVWQETWNDSDSPSPVGLPEGDGYQVKGHFNGNPPWGTSDGYCYFDVIAPANAEYIISARGYISSSTRSFCWGQDSGCLLEYYPEGDISGLNTEINAPTYDELLDRFGGGATSFSGSLPTTNGRWRTTGSIAVDNPLTFPNNRKILIFIDGTLTVNAEITVPQSSVVAFIATGIRFRKDLTGGSVITDKIGGLYIAEGDIETAYNYGGTEVTRRLVVDGSLISTKGTVVLKRRLSDANSTKYASEQIRLEPKYYVLIAQYLGEAQVSWKEVAP